MSGGSTRLSIINRTSIQLSTVLMAMQTNFELIRTRLLRRAGIPHGPEPKYLKYDDLERSEWSPDFERYMRNRLIMGALRYGLLHAPGKPKYDRIGSIIRRLETYQKDGNLEHLVDAANLCLMEFEEGDHPLKHFRAHDDGEHARVANKGVPIQDKM